MLEHLFGSKTRVKLLSLFLRHPEEAIFVRELTRRLDTQINAVRRELANLLKLGLIMETIESSEKSDGARRAAGVKKKFYRINRQCPLLPEISALILKAQLVLERKLDEDIVKLGDVRYLAFLGIFIGKAPSPVDLFVVGHLNQDALRKLLRSVEEELGCEINFSLMTPEEFRYRKDITDRFLYGILESPKNVVLDRLGERS